MVTYAFPPIGGSPVQRALYFAKYLGEFGWEPIVLQADRLVFYVTDPGLLRELPADVERHVVRALEPAVITEKWLEAFAESPRIVKRAAQAAGWVIARAVNRVGYWMLPDEKGLWGRYALRVANRICRGGIDAVYSSASPWICHWVAWKLKHRRRLPWVADFRDLWTQDPVYDTMSWVQRVSDRYHERRYLASADAVVSVSRGHTSALMARAGHDRPERFVTIRNGFEPGMFAGARPVRGPEGTFTMRYMGLLPAARVTPQLVSALRAVRERLASGGRRFRLELYGGGREKGLAQMSALGESFRHMGYVPHRRVAGLLAGADCLLLCINRGRNNRGVLTGKIFEYLGSGRPILCVTPVDGEAAEMIRSYQAGPVVDANDEASISRGLDEIVQAWEQGRPTSGADPGRLSPLHRRTQTARLAEVLDAVVAGRPPARGSPA